MIIRIRDGGSASPPRYYIGALCVEGSVPVNETPLVDAGEDIDIEVSEFAVLDGMALDDGLPAPPGMLTTTWELLDETGGVTITEPSALQTTVLFSEPGTYSFRLSAFDGALTGQDTVTVFVSPDGGLENEAPLVNAGSDATVTLPDTAQLNATVVDDGLPGETVFLFWELVDGPDNVALVTDEIEDPIVSFNTPGDYVFRLTADDTELSSFDEVKITVLPEPPENTPPAVDAGSDLVISLPNHADLDGTVSDDGLPIPPGVSTTQWTKVSGPDTVTFGNEAARDTTASFGSEGTYVLRLTAYDGSESNFDEIMITVLAMPPEVTRGPYLQIGTPSSIVICWRTDVATDSVVRYGTEQGSKEFIEVDTEVTTEHVVELSGLTSQTMYYYFIGDSTQDFAGGDDLHYFVTSPEVGVHKPTRFWILGDSGYAEDAADNDGVLVRDAFLEWNGSVRPDFWMMLGDNAYPSGTDEEYQSAVFDMYPDILKNCVLWSTRGNHERYSLESDSVPYYDIFSFPRFGEAGGLPSGSEAYYSFDYGDIHLICLDSFGTEDLTVDGPMLTWMQQDINANTQKWLIAYWHHPPYSKGSHDSDDTTKPNDASMIELRENALPILEAAGVDLVLGGHSHSYERSYLLHGHYGFSTNLTETMKMNGGNGRPGEDGAYVKPSTEGAVYIVSGSSSNVRGGGDNGLNHPAMVVSLPELGSVVVDIDGDQMEVYLIDDNAEVLDAFTLIKGEQDPDPNVVFDAYNDLSWASGQLTANITRYTTENGSGIPPDGAQGSLVDYLSGDPITATLTVSGGNWNGGSHATSGSLSDPGTDGASVFGGKVDATGIVSYDATDLVLAFTELNPSLTYVVELFGNRDKSSYADRLTQVSISGADAFSNKSTSGSSFSDASDPSTVTANGYNTLTGYVARFSDIDPGADGAFSLVVDDGGSESPPKYYASAVRLKALAAGLEGLLRLTTISLGLPGSRATT